MNVDLVTRGKEIMIYQKKEKRKRDKGTITIERKEVSNKDHFRYLGLTISKGIWRMMLENSSWIIKM